VKIRIVAAYIRLFARKEIIRIIVAYGSADLFQSKGGLALGKQVILCKYMTPLPQVLVLSGRFSPFSSAFSFAYFPDLSPANSSQK